MIELEEVQSGTSFGSDRRMYTGGRPDRIVAHQEEFRSEGTKREPDMKLNLGDISVQRQGYGVSIHYAGEPFIGELGIGLPINGNWLWSYDRSLVLVEESEGTGRDSHGEYSYIALVYAIPGVSAGVSPLVSNDDVPLIRQEIKAYDPSTGPARLLVETTVLEEICGTYIEDSFYHTTFNSPVLLFQKELNFLAYTWGLMGPESSRDGGRFPEAITGKGIATIPAALRLAGYSPREDLHTTSEKPFGPLVLYDDEGRTLVVSPFNHFLISPLRIIQTPSGMGVARGLHGSVDVLPRGATTQTALVFGNGVVETMVKWGDWMLKAGEKSRAIPVDNPLLENIGFWNCFGGYYTELFRQVDETVLKELAAYFEKEGIPVGYFGLDLWYNYGQVGFARNYMPDAAKYPQGLEPIHRETGLPYLLHMSAFESPNDYMGRYEFEVDEGSAYPKQRQFYEELAIEFKSWGAFGIWPDFLRTQLQNSRSLHNTIGNADRWFDGLAGAFDEQQLAMMMCMPTIGHYLASTRHENIVAVRTHSDYLNHQVHQVEALRATGQVRNVLPLQQSVRHNVLLSLLAHALGLCPSFDVFLTNRSHPEGFAEPNAETEALLRAMSGGVVAVGDKAGFIDKGIIKKLCFPDGRLAKPDHPPLPVVSTLQSDVLAFYTTTTVGACRWVYLANFNVSEDRAHYRLELHGLAGTDRPVVYDYFAGKVLQTAVLEGDLEPAEGHYYVIMPQIGGLYFLGFPDKYITVSSRQVPDIEPVDGGVTVSFQLPIAGAEVSAGKGSDPLGAGEHEISDWTRPDQSLYTVALYAPSEVDVRADGAEVRRIQRAGGLLHVEFAATSEKPSLCFRLANHTDSR